MTLSPGGLIRSDDSPCSSGCLYDSERSCVQHAALGQVHRREQGARRPRFRVVKGRWTRLADNLFKVLYKDANPEQKRAMLKSIQQSHGKVLNMNWSEVKDNSYDEAKKD